jgi:hypothetical protein
MIITLGSRVEVAKDDVDAVGNLISKAIVPVIVTEVHPYLPFYSGKADNGETISFSSVEIKSVLPF